MNKTLMRTCSSVSAGENFDGKMIKSLSVSRPAPGRNFTCCSSIPGFGRSRGQGRGNYH